MARRLVEKQSEHDAVVKAAEDTYRQKGKHVWTNPGSETNKSWSERYIDVIAVDTPSDTTAWVTEIETDDSVSEAEAREQWRDFDEGYTAWHLAVPEETKAKAERLVNEHGLRHCAVITWRRNDDGTHVFSGLPGA